MAGLASVGFDCGSRPNASAVAFPDDRGLLIVGESNSEHGGGEELQYFRVDDDALRSLGTVEGTSDTGRPDEGEMRHEDVRVNYTRSSIVVDAHVKRSACKTADTCKLVEEKDERRTFELVSGKLARK